MRHYKFASKIKVYNVIGNNYPFFLRLWCILIITQPQHNPPEKVKNRQKATPMYTGFEAHREECQIPCPMWGPQPSQVSRVPPGAPIGSTAAARLHPHRKKPKVNWRPLIACGDHLSCCLGSSFLTSAVRRQAAAPTPPVGPRGWLHGRRVGDGSHGACRPGCTTPPRTPENLPGFTNLTSALSRGFARCTQQMVGPGAARLSRGRAPAVSCPRTRTVPSASCLCPHSTPGLEERSHIHKTGHW
uniref:uncharacterized protein LOC118527419 isoform X2 n=1 Tax=Halichoerus grypus TaxID=9711 RepID=UPI001659EAB2|nr:uncharacterized protein LOC118527419 isoform X2 [Halichoerus grypus]